MYSSPYRLNSARSVTFSMVASAPSSVTASRALCAKLVTVLAAWAEDFDGVSWDSLLGRSVVSDQWSVNSDR